MKAYKATDNMKCKELTYEVGKTYTFKGKLILCEQGFHVCRAPKDTLNYYDYNKNFKLLEVEILGEVIESNNKLVTNKLKVLRVVPEREMLKLLNIKVKYDKNNNLIYYKSSDNYKEWYKYDENNNIIHYRDSNGDEYWKEYDENNNLIFYKNSNGDEYSITIKQFICQDKKKVFDKSKKILERKTE